MPTRLRRFLNDYGMLLVLILLCVYYSAATMTEQSPRGAEAARAAVADVEASAGSAVVVAVRGGAEEVAFARAAREALEARGFQAVVVEGTPQALRQGLEGLPSGTTVGAIVTTRGFENVVRSVTARVAGLEQVAVATPQSQRFPTFLRADNLRNVANQIVVIAIIAVGMTMVIITAGIDLSVGSLIALSAVVAAVGIRAWGGAEAGLGAMLGASLLAILACGLIGFFSGLTITQFNVPPFIATLGMMLVASGLAYIIASGESIYEIPDSYVWLGRGADLFSIPNAVVLMVVIYAVAHVLMTRTTLGRYIYAIGGNPEAARLSGIRVNAVLLFVYTVSGLVAGLGGIIQASQLKSGAPTYGLTSLAGGEGRILGTLIGAFIIGVIQNGMNLTGVESYTQKVVLGLVILGAVLLDMLKKKDWWRRKTVAA